MTMLTRNTAALAKIETTYGVDSVPDGTANAILLRNVTPTPQESDLVNRDVIRPYLGNSEQLAAAIHSTIDFEVEIAGSGTPGQAPSYGPLLRACGFQETVNPGVSVVYAPISTGFESLSMRMHLDGVLHALLGARGTVSFDLSSKALPVMKFKFTGLYVPVADAVQPSVTLTGWKKPVPVNKANTTLPSLHGYAGAVVSGVSFDMANKVVYRPLINAESVLITDRAPAGNITIEAVNVATKDWWTEAQNAVTGPLSLVHGNVAGNIVQFDAPSVQLTKPSYQDQDGIRMLQMGLVMVPGSSGNDEFTITVK